MDIKNDTLTLTGPAEDEVDKLGVTVWKYLLGNINLRKFIGSWKGEIAKDTTIFWEVKSYGTGMECYFKAVTKGKLLWKENNFGNTIPAPVNLQWLK